MPLLLPLRGLDEPRAGSILLLPLGGPGTAPTIVAGTAILTAGDTLSAAGTVALTGSAGLSEGDTFAAVGVSTAVIGFIGDSITAGDIAGMGSTTPPQATATDLTTMRLAVASANQGHDGATTADWVPGAAAGYLAAAKTAFAAAGVRVVHVMLGANDSNNVNNFSAATYQTYLGQMVSNLTASGYTVVLSYPCTGSGTPPYHASINALVDGVSVFLGDTQAYPYFQAHSGELVDALHPNPTGVGHLGQFWAQALQPFLPGTIDGALGLSGGDTLAGTGTGAATGTGGLTDGDTLGAVGQVVESGTVGLSGADTLTVSGTTLDLYGYDVLHAAPSPPLFYWRLTDHP